MPTAKDTAIIARLDTKLDGAISQIADLKAQFNTFQAGFIRTDVYTIRHEELLRQVAANTMSIERLQKSRWIMPSITMILGGVMVFLINYAITH